MNKWMIAISWVLANFAAGDERLDEWVGDSAFAENSIMLNVGQDNDAGRFYGGNLLLALPSYIQLDLAYSNWESEFSENNNAQVSFEDELQKETAFHVWVNTDEWHRWSFSVGYENIDRQDVLNSEDLALEARFSADAWTFTGVYLSGQVTVLADWKTNRFNFYREVDVSRRGYGLEINYDYAAWSWRLQYESYDYDRNLDFMETRGRLRNQLQSYFVLDRGSYLSDWRVASDIQLFVDKFTLLVGVSQSESLATDDALIQLYSGVNYQFSEKYSAGVFSGILPDEDFIYTEFTLAYHW